MKKLIIIALAFISSISLIAQEKEEPQPLKHEVHLNVLSPIVAKSFEVNYEYLNNDHTSFGLSVFVLDPDTDLNYMISPYFRKYFSNKYAAGFFLESFLSLNGGEGMNDIYIEETETYETTYEKYTDLAFGVGIGYKFIAKGNFVGIINAGVARNMFSDNSMPIIGKGGIYFGYRF